MNDVAITEADLAELWRRNPLAFEQVKVIVLERILGETQKRLQEAENKPCVS